MAAQGRTRITSAQRRQLRAEAAWHGAPMPDRSWMKFIRCKGCGTKLCVNNYQDRRTRIRADSRFYTPEGKVAVLCFRCKRFRPLFLMLVDRVTHGSNKAQKIWDSYPQKPTPGQA